MFINFLNLYETKNITTNKKNFSIHASVCSTYFYDIWRKLSYEASYFMRHLYIF